MIKRISFTLIWNGNVGQRDLLYFDLEWNVNQRDLLYFDNLELKWWSKGSRLLWSGFGMMIKGISSTSIWNGNVDQSDLLYFVNLEQKWWSKGSPLLWSSIGMIIKGIFVTSIWNGMMIKRISSTLIIWNWNNDQRGLLYFDNLELKWWS